MNGLRSAAPAPSMVAVRRSGAASTSPKPPLIATIGVKGQRHRTSRMASTPSLSGISRSVSSTSGRVAIARWPLGRRWPAGTHIQGR